MPNQKKLEYRQLVKKHNNKFYYYKKRDCLIYVNNPYIHIYDYCFNEKEVISRAPNHTFWQLSSFLGREFLKAIDEVYTSIPKEALLTSINPLIRELIKKKLKF